MRWGAALALVAALPAPAQPSLPRGRLANTQLADASQERAAKALMETLRCLVCQGQSIADSDADMAADMRSLVRERIARGEEPEAIRRWLVARYGDYVSYQPRFDMLTAPLWLAPVLLLTAGLFVARASFRRKRR